MVRILAFMGASAAEIPTSPDEQPAPGLRASDAERDEVAARLRDEYVAGRLSHDTFVHRMHAVLESRQQADLPPLIADLPAQRRAAPVPGVAALLGWFRGAWSRATRPAAPARTLTAGGALVRGTMGMISASGDPNSPLLLQFPRGGDGQFSIGRDASCDLAIADMTVSRRHAILERTADGWLLRDLESTNGTRVNGWRVRGSIAVRPGDLISFGNLVAVFAREDTVPPGTVSPESARAPDRP